MQFLTSLNTVGWGLLVLVVMLWIQVDGKPLMDLPAAARTGVNWEVIFFFAMIMYIPGILTHPDTGLSGLLVTVAQPLVASRGALAFAMILLIIGTVITNFFNNTVTALLLMQILLTFSGNIGCWRDQSLGGHDSPYHSDQYGFLDSGSLSDG